MLLKRHTYIFKGGTLMKFGYILLIWKNCILCLFPQLADIFNELGIEYTSLELNTRRKLQKNIILFNWKISTKSLEWIITRASFHVMLHYVDEISLQ